MKSILTSCIWVLLYGCLQAAAPSKDEVLRAVDDLRADVFDVAGSKALATVVRYAEESDAVSIMISPDTVPWMNEGSPNDPEEIVRQVLLGAYYAGEIKAQLDRSRSGDDPYSGWRMVFTIYRQVQKKRQFKLESVEALIALDREGRLAKHAEDVLAKNRTKSEKGQPSEIRPNQSSQRNAMAQPVSVFESRSSRG